MFLQVKTIINNGNVEKYVKICLTDFEEKLSEDWCWHTFQNIKNWAHFCARTFQIANTDLHWCDIFLRVFAYVRLNDGSVVWFIFFAWQWVFFQCWMKNVLCQYVCILFRKWEYFVNVLHVLVMSFPHSGWLKLWSCESALFNQKKVYFEINFSYMQMSHQINYSLLNM